MKSLEKLILLKITRKILLAGCSVLSLFNRCIPKNPKKIMFYGKGSPGFYDNSRALYEYMIEHDYQKNYLIICCVNMENFDFLRVPGVRCVGIIKGILHFFTSKYCFYSHGSMRIRASKDQIMVNTWHGSPLKTIGKFIRSNGILQTEKIDDFSYILSAAPFFNDVFADAFGCPKEKILVQGHARNDYLFSTTNTLDALGINKEKFLKTVLWMPTFRISKDGRFNDSKTSGTGLPLMDSFSTMEKFNNFLQEKRILLTVKWHHYTNVSIEDDYSNIILVTNDMIMNHGFQLYEFAKDFDALLTDYSSIYFDYLLLNRPIGFIIDDIDLYEKNRGFSIENPLDIMPGHHIKTIDELKGYINDLVAGEDAYEAQRKQVRDLTNYYQDNHSRKRLLDYLGIGCES